MRAPILILAVFGTLGFAGPAWAECLSIQVSDPSELPILSAIVSRGAERVSTDAPRKGADLFRCGRVRSQCGRQVSEPLKLTLRPARTVWQSASS